MHLCPVFMPGSFISSTMHASLTALNHDQFEFSTLYIQVLNVLVLPLLCALKIMARKDQIAMEVTIFMLLVVPESRLKSAESSRDDFYT